MLHYLVPTYHVNIIDGHDDYSTIINNINILYY